MNVSLKTFSTISIAAGFALFSTLAMAKDISKQFDVANGGTLNLKTQVGSIRIDTHDDSRVLLEVETKGLDDDEFEVEYEVDGADLIVTGKLRNRKGWYNNIGAKFRLTVPKQYNLRLQTSGGAIAIDDLTGDIDARTSGGSIKVGNVQGSVDLHTSGGSITTEAIYGPLDAHTSGGSINVTFAKQLEKDAELHTSGGSITAYLIDSIQIDLDASTSGGRVKTDFDVDGRVNKRTIRGEINGGGPLLKLHTSGGSVSVRSL